MNLVSKPTTTRLAHRELLRLQASAGDRVDCLDGSVWITQDRDPRDIVLAAGQSFIADRTGTAIVEALMEGAVAVQLAIPTAAVIAANSGSRAPRADRRPLSFAIAAVAATASWLLIAFGLPSGELQQAPRPSSRAVEWAHAGQEGQASRSFTLDRAGTAIVSALAHQGAAADPDARANPHDARQSVNAHAFDQ